MKAATKRYLPWFIILGSVILLAFIGVVLSNIPVHAPSPTDEPQDDDVVFCTMDAKACPDGSYVGRVPPSCAFAACPGE